MLGMLEDDFFHLSEMAPLLSRQFPLSSWMAPVYKSIGQPPLAAKSAKSLFPDEKILHSHLTLKYFP